MKNPLKNFFENVEILNNSKRWKLNFRADDLVRIYKTHEKDLEDVVLLSEIKKLRKEMGTVVTHNEGEQSVLWTCTCMLDDLIENQEGKN